MAAPTPSWAYATVQDLQDRFPRTLTAAELAQAPVMLQDASFRLDQSAPGLREAMEAATATDPPTRPDLVYGAMLWTVTMVKRALLAQAAQAAASPVADSVTEAWGPYSQSIKYKSDSANLFLYDSELADLMSLIYGYMTDAVSMRSPGL